MNYFVLRITLRFWMNCTIQDIKIWPSGVLSVWRRRLIPYYLFFIYKAALRFHIVSEPCACMGNWLLWNIQYIWNADASNRALCLDLRTINTFRPRQNGHRFADDTFKRIFLNENVRISTEMSLKCVPKGPINNISALVQIMARRRPIYHSLPTHTCVTRPQWVNGTTFEYNTHEYQLGFC